MCVRGDVCVAKMCLCVGDVYESCEREMCVRDV